MHLYEKMDSRYREERKDARRGVRRFRIDRETLERSLGPGRKGAYRGATGGVYSALTRRDLTLKIKSGEIQTIKRALYKS